MNSEKLDALLDLLQQVQGDAARSRSAAWTVQSLCDLYLDWSRTHNAPATYGGNREFLNGFCATGAGALAVGDLKAHHVNRWLDSHPRWRGARRNAIVAVQRVFNWAVDEGHIDASPIKRMKKPACGRRERILSADERAQLLARYPNGDPFRDFLATMLGTGARPSEVMRVEAKHFSAADCAWVFKKHKTSERTAERKDRIIVLTPAMLAITLRLIEAHPRGPLFRNADGKPWNRNAVRCRFRRARKTLGLADVCAYTCRHTYATDALEAGVPDASLAELLGHVDTKMIHRHYSKLSTKRKHLADMARRATGDSVESTAPAEKKSQQP